MEAHRADLDLAAEKLAGEIADVEASIELVSMGVASRVTLTGMRFGQQVADRLQPVARLAQVELETTFWPEDTVCDISVVRSLAEPATPPPTTDV